MIQEITSFSVGTKIVFGKDASHHAGLELKVRNKKRALIVTDKGIVNAGLLGNILESLENSGIEYIVFDEVPPNPPSSTVAKGVEIFKEKECDSLVAVGGGSSIDACKAIGIMTVHDGGVIEYDNSSYGNREFQKEGPPVITVPTTSGTGSEVTQWALITDEKRNWKSAVGSPLMFPTVALVDPALTIGLPPSLTAATGIDALTHAIEAYTSKRAITGASPLTDAICLKSIELVGENLRKAYAQGDNYEARRNIMIGSTMAGVAFPQIGLGSTHALAHPLSGHFDVPHGVANAILLPYIMEYNLMCCPERFANIARSLGENIEGLNQMEAAEKAVVAIDKLKDDLNIPSLKSFKVDPRQFDILAEDAIQDGNNVTNPRNTGKEQALSLYLKAYNEDSLELSPTLVGS